MLTHQCYIIYLLKHSVQNSSRLLDMFTIRSSQRQLSKYLFITLVIGDMFAEESHANKRYGTPSASRRDMVYTISFQKRYGTPSASRRYVVHHQLLEEIWYIISFQKRYGTPSASIRDMVYTSNLQKRYGVHHRLLEEIWCTPSASRIDMVQTIGFQKRYGVHHQLLEEICCTPLRTLLAYHVFHHYLSY